MIPHLGVAPTVLDKILATLCCYVLRLEDYRWRKRTGLTEGQEPRYSGPNCSAANSPDLGLSVRDWTRWFLMLFLSGCQNR